MTENKGNLYRYDVADYLNIGTTAPPPRLLS